MLNSREYLIALSLKHDGDVYAIFDAIRTKESLSDEEIEIFKKTISAMNCSVLTIIDENYPDHLKQINMPPIVLFYYGDLSLISDMNKNLSFIGSRKNSDYGERMTRKLVKGLCKDFNIVSGMARGIDGISHDEAIKSGGRTIAVLGTGINYPYPKENTALYEEIKKKHLVISEYFTNKVEQTGRFPNRNRIIAGLSRAVILTEAHNKSGTAITATFAAMYGRDVCCVPYHADEDSYCNTLINDGAKLVEKPEDIYDEIGEKPSEKIF